MRLLFYLNTKHRLGVPEMVKKIILPDIFGHTHAMTKMVDWLSTNSEQTCAVIDPYESKVQVLLNDEATAYDYFMSQVGLDAYFKKTLDALTHEKEAFELIGFSVGATTAWRVAAQPIANLKAVTCFYGSQIRNFATLQPLVPTKLVFPAYEAHFDVDALIKHLRLTYLKSERAHQADAAWVEIKQLPYLHGYMNPLSVNYNAEAYLATLQALSPIF